MINPPSPLAPASATVSLGKPGGHSIPSILEATAKAGLKGIEICYNNLLHHAVQLTNANSTEDIDLSAPIEAAKDTKRICSEHGLKIITFQPFAVYEGLIDEELHRQKVEKFKQWLQIVKALECDVMQMPSNWEREGTTGEMSKLVADLQEVADLAAKEDPVVSIAYEAIGWGAHVYLWEHSWEVVKAVDRANVGLCLDTFHIAGRVWADPEAESGKNVNGDEALKNSLEKLVKELPLEKVLYLQLSDAERLSKPLIEGHEYYDPSMASRMSWSRNARLFPCEEEHGGYMPVLPIAKAIVNDLGYRGWVSMEMFSRYLLDESDQGIPERFAQRAMMSYQKVWKELEWDTLIETNGE
jgi:4-hydroxyphenylpyruvate dioxygenase